ncbi:MAG: ankyrin repeat domain-containing protein [Candidatus Brocadiia bacterium]
MQSAKDKVAELVERSRFLSDLAARLRRFRHSLGSTAEDVTWVQRIGMLLVLLAVSGALFVAWVPLLSGLVRHRWTILPLCSLAAAAGVIMNGSLWERMRCAAMVVVLFLSAGLLLAYCVPFQHAAALLLPRAVSQGDHELVRLALDHGADPSDPRFWALSPLEDAVTSNMPGITRILLEHGADPNATDFLGLPPLSQACILHYREVASVLLAHGADARAKDATGLAPLHRAAVSGDVELVRMLLEAGANPDARGPDDITPAELAQQGGHEKAARRIRGWHGQR